MTSRVLPGTSGTGHASRGVPLVFLIGLAWTVVYLLLMAHGGWHWQGRTMLDFGAPGGSSLERFGAPIPARVEAGQWQRVLLGPWLHRSLLGLLLLVWFQASVGRSLVSLFGRARAWLVFLAGGTAGALAHVLSYGGSEVVGGAGPFDAILGGLGALLLWGILNKGPAASAVVRSTVVSLLLVGLLAWYVTRDAPDTAEVRALISRESALGGLGGGLFALFLLGPRRATAPAGRATRISALAGLALLLLAAGLQAHQVLASTHPERTARFLERLEQTEYEAWRIAQDPRRTTPQDRAALAERLAALEHHGFLDELDDEAVAALMSYLAALGVYATGDVPRPWQTEAACRDAFRAWHEGFEKPLRARAGVSARIDVRHYWETR